MIWPPHCNARVCIGTSWESIVRGWGLTILPGCAQSGQVPTEIHGLETRSTGQSLTVFFNFMASFSIAQAFLSILCRFTVSPCPCLHAAPRPSPA